MESDQIRRFLAAVGDHYPHPAELYLLGGSALCLLGNPRPTLDIDYVGDDLKKDELQLAMEEIAREMSLDVEAVPVDRFIPLPAGAFRRRLKVGKFGKIKVYVFDPYSIAVSKIDRGFDTDLDDIIFLLQHRFISLEELERITRAALPRAREFDMNEGEILARLQELKARLA